MGGSDRFGDGARALAVTLLVHGVAVAFLTSLCIERSTTPLPYLIARSRPSTEPPQNKNAPSEPSPLNLSDVTNPQRRLPDWDFSYPPKVILPPPFARAELPPPHIPIDPHSLTSPFPRVPLSRSSLPKSSSPPEIDAIGTVPVTGWTGIELTMDQQYHVPRIVRVIPGGPAHRQGVLGNQHHGDFIITVDGQSTRHRSLEESQRLIVGEADTIVALGLSRFPGSMVSIVKIRRGR